MESQKGKEEVEDPFELSPDQIALNLKTVREKIDAALKRSGRGGEKVELCAVSKKKSIADIRAAMDAGQFLFGENYVQEIREKYDVLQDSCHWYMIGHLQRNKVKYIIDKVEMIHSVDSVELAEQIEKEAAKQGRTMDILLEVNVAGEESKWGFTPEGVLYSAEKIAALEHIRVKGLMTSAPYTENAESNRIYFRHLREILKELQKAGLPNVEADTLSMGMTRDYEVAVEEGATIVRVGTGIFGERNYAK